MQTRQHRNMQKMQYFDDATCRVGFGSSSPCAHNADRIKLKAVNRSHAAKILSQAQNGEEAGRKGSWQRIHLMICFKLKNNPECLMNVNEPKPKGHLVPG